MLNLTTQQLQYLVALDRAATLQQAATDLGVSPSALSQGLTELERRIGVVLFERQGRARALTPRGRELVELADRVLGATQDLSLWAERAATGVSGMVRLGMIDIAAVAHFPQVLSRFRAQRPDVDLRLTVAPSSDLLQRLQAGQLDAAVVVGPRRTGDLDRGVEVPMPEHRDLTARDLMAEELAVYAPPDPDGGRRGAPRSPADWGPWVTFPASSTTRAQIATALRALGAEFQVAAESHQPDVLRQLVQLGMGWTVLPVPQGEAEPTPLVRVRPTPLLTRRLVVAKRRRAAEDPATNGLLDQLRAHAELLGDGPRSPSRSEPN